MRGQPEAVESYGLGKKIETPKETAPVTRRVEGKQHHYETDGKRSYCPPVPDAPQHAPSIWDIYIANNNAGRTIVSGNTVDTTPLPEIDEDALGIVCCAVKFYLKARE